MEKQQKQQRQTKSMRKETQSMILENQNKPTIRISQSQIIKPKQTVQMKHKDQIIEYQVYSQNCFSFSNIQRFPLIPLTVDEDCQTTLSNLRYGQRLCIRDLEYTMKYENNCLQSNKSSNYQNNNDSP